LDENPFYRRLMQTTTSGEGGSLESLAFEIGNTVLQEGAFPSAYFEALMALLEEEHFLHLEGSWKLIRVFEENWSELSNEQRRILLAALERQYESFTDWMACFVISGVLGEQYGNDDAFKALLRLASSKKEMPRSFVPHGLEHIARQSADPNLAQRAFDELVKMKGDQSEMVRGEVAESLARLAKLRGGRPR
jgi:hypothetical protein